MTSYLDPNLITHFPENYWTDGWALSFYSKAGVKSKLGDLVNMVKYNQYVENDYEVRLSAGNDILDTIKEFIASKYPRGSRPFDAAICPPSNLNRAFDLTHHIASHLESGGIHNWSKRLLKTREVTTMKQLSAHERRLALDGAYRFNPVDVPEHSKGILIVDDVLDTGATSREICKVLETVFPGIPKYYVAVTYIMDQKTEMR